MRILIALLLLCSIVHAGEKIDSFEGLESTKEDGVLIIDYSPGSASDVESKKQWEKIHTQREIEKNTQREIEMINEKYQREIKKIAQKHQSEKDRIEYEGEQMIKAIKRRHKYGDK